MRSTQPGPPSTRRRKLASRSLGCSSARASTPKCCAAIRSAVLVASERAVSELGLEPAAYLSDWEVVGVDPRIMGIGPVPATRALLERNRVAFEAVESVELNEAFASQVVACLRELPFDPERVNPDGGAIAIGHPIGCTGARIVTTLVHGMASRGERLGVATLCVSGGLGLAALIERP